MKKSRNGKFTIYEENDKCALDEYSEVLAEELENEFENNDKTVKELKQKNTEQDTTIEELKAENIELKAENERLNNDINAISVTVPAEGENITLNDTAEARFKKFGIGGNSWQKTRSGKNIINITSVSSNDKASFDNETKEATLLEGFKGTFYLYFPETTFKSGKTYLIEIFLSKSTTNSKQVEFLLKYDDNKFTDNWLNINSSSNYYVASYTPSEDIIANRFQVYGSSTNIVDGEIKFKVQIRENTTESGYEDYGAMPSTNYKSDIQNVTGNANIKITNGLENTDINYQEQTFSFPLQEGQRLMLGDYLADDGIHHKRKQIVFDGTEDWIWRDTTRYSINLENIGGSNSMCSHYTYKKYSGGVTSTDKTFCVGDDLTYIGFFDAEITSLKKWKKYLAEQYANGTPVVVEYDLAEEEIESYIPEQQTVHDETKKTAHSYGEQTHIFSTDETSLIFNVEARKDMNTVISNLESMIISNASEEV